MKVNTKLLAGFAILVLLVGTSSRLISPVFADTPQIEIEKAKALLQARAQVYLKEIGREAIKDTTQMRYGEFKVVQLKGPDRDRQADIEKSKALSEARAQALLESQTHEAMKSLKKKF